jgi:hypothetical protein
VYARRLALLPPTIGRRCGGSTVLATAPATAKFRLSKGIPEPWPVAGISPEQDSHLSNPSWPGSSRPSTFPLLLSYLGSEDVDARHPSTPRRRRAFSVLSRRSFSEGGKAGHDGNSIESTQLATRQPSAPHC